MLNSRLIRIDLISIGNTNTTFFSPSEYGSLIVRDVSQFRLRLNIYGIRTGSRLVAQFVIAIRTCTFNIANPLQKRAHQETLDIVWLILCTSSRLHLGACTRKIVKIFSVDLL